MASLTYIEAIRLAMLEEMERDERVFVIGEDVGTYGGAFRATQGFLEKFGETRVIDTPISETAIVGAAIGAALMGMRPIAEMQFIDFISCAFDMHRQLRGQDAATAGERASPSSCADPAGAASTAAPSTARTPRLSS